MAKKKKSRVPAPPRPAQGSRGVQAPQRRVEQRDERRTRIWFLAVGGAILIAAAAVGIAMAFRGGGGGAESSGVEGPCVRKTYPALKALHIETLPQRTYPKDYKYNSFPPSSGYHSEQTAIWNVYDAPVPEQNLVHNLEHGGVAVQYGPEVPQATVAKIVAWYDDSTEGMIVTPLPPVDEMRAPAPPADFEKKIFLVAWTHVATCTAFDEDAFTNFRDDYRGPDGDAPEKFPLSSLQQGGQ